jgi:hypothetical protein
MSIFASGFDWMNLVTIFRILVLKAAAKPLSPVTTMSRILFSGRSDSRG